MATLPDIPLIPSELTGFDLQTFKSAFEGGGRAYTFIWVPTMIEVGWNSRYFVRTASMPESTVEEMTTHWQGMKYTVGGPRTFTDWTLTLYCDAGSSIRNAFELWMHEIHSVLPVGQYYGKPEGLLKYGYLRSQGLIMLNNNGGSTTGVYLTDSWPKAVGPITLDYSTPDIASFDVTMSYSYHVIVPLNINAIPIPITGPGV